jgi:hypothetical protein
MSKLLSLFSRGGSQSSTDAIRQSTSLTMAYLLEQNRKFEFFMRQKVEELEERVSAQQQTRQGLEYEDEVDDHEIDRVEEVDPDRGEPAVLAPITSADVDEPFGSPVVPLSAEAAARPIETGSPRAEDGQAETSTDAPLPAESLAGDELQENILEVSPSPAPEPDIPAEDQWLVMLGGEAEAPVASPRQPTSLVVSECYVSTETEGKEGEPAGIEANRSEVETSQAEPETEGEAADSHKGEEGSTAAEATDEPAEAGKAEMIVLETEDEPAEEVFGEAWPTGEIGAEVEANDVEMTEPERWDETENERVADPATKPMSPIGLQSQIKMSGVQAEEAEDNDSLLPSWVTAQLKN